MFDHSEKVFRFLEFVCTPNQDEELMKKLEGAGLHMRCKQLVSTKRLWDDITGRPVPEPIIVEYNSGCELRYL